MRRGPDGRPLVTYSLTARDVALARRGASVVGQMMLAAGARHVEPGIHGVPAVVDDPSQLRALEREGPRAASAYSMAATHLFGTCRMSSDPARAVVRPDFRHRRVEGLYVADSSVFPSNTGVNPQTSILALATLCAERVAEQRGERLRLRSSRMPVRRGAIEAVAAPHLEASTLIRASDDDLRALLRRGRALAPDAVAGYAYRGTSLGLPRLVDALLWKRFIKVFSARADGSVHGWNVRVDQRSGAVRRDRAGEPRCFGPYEVETQADGTLLLDYGAGARSRFDPLRAMRDPLCAVNTGSVELLIGCSYLALGRRSLMTPSMFVLERAEPLDPSRHGRL
ncbi:MAG: hypothetical protein KC503_41845 [Myxococcales bacterium]|nr:hypothetical protein [Myxococcales bacterium]